MSPGTGVLVYCVREGICCVVVQFIMSLSVLSVAVDKLQLVRQSEFAVASYADGVFEIGFFDRSRANLASAEDGYESIRFYEEGSEIGKNKTVHNALRLLDRLAGLGRIGQEWQARRVREATI
jgi:hypothetical protein